MLEDLGNDALERSIGLLPFGENNDAGTVNLLVERPIVEVVVGVVELVGQLPNVFWIRR